MLSTFYHLIVYRVKIDKKVKKEKGNENEKILNLFLLIINWVIVAIQAFTIFLYGNSIGLFIIMLLALIAQVFSVYDNRKKIIIRWDKIYEQNNICVNCNTNLYDY